MLRGEGDGVEGRRGSESWPQRQRCHLGLLVLELAEQLAGILHPAAEIRRELGVLKGRRQESAAGGERCVRIASGRLQQPVVTQIECVACLTALLSRPPSASPVYSRSIPVSFTRTLPSDQSVLSGSSSSVLLTAPGASTSRSSPISQLCQLLSALLSHAGLSLPTRTRPPPVPALRIFRSRALSPASRRSLRLDSTRFSTFSRTIV